MYQIIHDLDHPSSPIVFQSFLFEIHWTGFSAIYVEEVVCERAIGGTSWSESLSKLPKTSLNCSRWAAEAWTLVTKWWTFDKHFHKIFSTNIFTYICPNSFKLGQKGLSAVAKLVFFTFCNNVCPPHISSSNIVTKKAGILILGHCTTKWLQQRWVKSYSQFVEECREGGAFQFLVFELFVSKVGK